MEEKTLLKFKTAIPFPLLVYKTNVKYNEVRKASGVAFILLDVIEKMAGAEEKICDVLLKFGIPRDLHYIFGKEINSLIGMGILSTDYLGTHFMNQKYFSEIKVREVTLTAKGKKLFKDGAIPTGEEKVKSKDIYYSPVTRKFDVSSSLHPTSLDSCVLYEDIDSFLRKVDISGLKEYIEANPSKIGLKAEDRVIDVDTPEGGKKLQVRKEEGVQVAISDRGVEFSFDTSDEREYFNKWYSSALMTKCLLAKEKYKFVDTKKTEVDVPTVKLSKLNNIVRAYIPDDVSKQAKRPCKIFIDGGRLATGRTDRVLRTSEELSEKILANINEKAEFALLDLSALHYYSALNVKMPCEQFDDIFEMQLLIESVAEYDVYKETVKEIFDSYISMLFNEDVAKVVLFTVDALQDSAYFGFAAKKLLEQAKNVDDKIKTVLILNTAFSKNAEWQPYFISIATELFSESASEITIDSAIYKSAVLEPLRKELDMNDFDYISKFAEEMMKTEEGDIVYEALRSVGFSIDSVLTVVNVVEDFAEKVINNEDVYSDSELGRTFHNIGHNLWKLNKMLGIENYSEYTLKDDYNEEEFFNVYATLKAACKLIEKYEKYAPKSYETLKKYMAIYEPIHEMLAIERNSSFNPEKITKEYIDSIIDHGKFKEAICDLFIKVQYDLREMLNAEPIVKAHILLDAAKEKGIIDEKQKTILHQLRKCRNGFQHPEGAEVKFDKETIHIWRDAAFAIEGERK